MTKKLEIFQKKIQTSFEKYFFDKKYLIFFYECFFKIHLLIQENQDKAISERFWQFENKKTQGKKVVDRI